jgi:hypothetical protein
MIISVSMLIQTAAHAPSGSYIQMVPGTPSQQGPLLDYEQDYAGHNTHCQPGWYARFILRAWARWEYQGLMGWVTEDSLFYPRQKQQIFLCFKNSWTAPGPTCLPLRWDSEDINPGLKRLEREPYQSTEESVKHNSYIILNYIKYTFGGGYTFRPLRVHLQAIR